MYGNQGRTALLSGSPSEEQVPYEKSFLGALEEPVRYLVTFMAFSQRAPTTITAQYLAPAWRGAVILSLVWFLHRWKTNVFTHALATQSLPGLDRDKLLAMDNISSVGLFVIGIMALAEACGVAVQSIMTVGGIGGVATAFAARDILGNVLSGLSSGGNGTSTTCLLNAEKFPLIVPNSLFSSQISTDIKSMLRSHSKHLLQCLFCDYRAKESYTLPKKRLLRSAQIIKEHGAKLGGTYQDITSQ
ncbi:unnamed protein product [Malus baccata var. baccata]